MAAIAQGKGPSRSASSWDGEPRDSSVWRFLSPTRLDGPCRRGAHTAAAAVASQESVLVRPRLSSRASRGGDWAGGARRTPSARGGNDGTGGGGRGGQGWLVWMQRRTRTHAPRTHARTRTGVQTAWHWFLYQQAPPRLLAHHSKNLQRRCRCHRHRRVPTPRHSTFTLARTQSSRPFGSHRSLLLLFIFLCFFYCFVFARSGTIVILLPSLLPRNINCELDVVSTDVFRRPVRRVNNNNPYDVFVARREFRRRQSTTYL